MWERGAIVIVLWVSGPCCDFFFWWSCLFWQWVRGKRNGVVCGRAAEFGWRWGLAGNASPAHPAGGPAPAAAPPHASGRVSTGWQAARRSGGARRATPWRARRAALAAALPLPPFVREGAPSASASARARRAPPRAAPPPRRRRGGGAWTGWGAPRVLRRAAQRRWRRAGGGATATFTVAAPSPSHACSSDRDIGSPVGGEVGTCARVRVEGSGCAWRQQPYEARSGATAGACARGTRSRTVGCTPLWT